MGPGSRSLCSLVRDDEIDSIFSNSQFWGHRHCERSEAIHGAAPRKNGLLRRGVYHRARRRRDPLAPRNDDQ